MPVCVISYFSLTEGLFGLIRIFIKRLLSFLLNLGCSSPVSWLSSYNVRAILPWLSVDPSESVTGPALDQSAV